MRVLPCVLFLLTMQSFARAAPSSVWWPQWKVHSSEELHSDKKYSSYPSPLMLDGDTKTAWVYSAKSKQYDKNVFASRYGFVFTPSTPIPLNALRIMNGQNLSRARFLANHRFLKIRVTLNLSDGKKVITSAKLTDAMGWHLVKLPRHKVESLKVELLDFKRGNSKDSDVCISELELRDNSKKLEWHLPRAVMFWDGLEGCGASLLISRYGKSLTGIATDIGYKDKWSSSGQYVAGYAGGDNYVWIADVWKGEVLRRVKYPPNANAADHVDVDYRWRNATTLEITESRQNKKQRYRFLKAPNFQ